MNNENQVLEALAIIIKSAKASDKLLVEYKLWEHIEHEAKMEALRRFREFKSMLMMGYRKQLEAYRKCLPQLEVLHKKECGCGWDGETIFTEGWNK